MERVLELIGVIVLFVAGAQAGRSLGRGRGWWVGFAVSLLAVGLVVVGHRSAIWSVRPPFSWAVSQTFEPLLMAVCVPLMLSTLIVRLGAKRQRVIVSVLMWVMAGNYAVVPIVLPWVVRRSLAATPTQVDLHGICLQTHAYTCGPAAAVTCLHALGVKAEEGSLAIAAESGPGVGTDGPLLAEAVNRLYGSSGVHCRYGFVGSIDALKTPAVAAIVSPVVGGHYVAVLDVTDNTVVVGDPMSGRDRLTREEFVAQWRGLAHEFSR